MMLRPAKGKVLVDVMPCDTKRGLVMNDRDEKPYKGLVIAVGEGVSNTILGQYAYFRYHFGYQIPDTNPEKMVIEVENIEAYETEE